MNGSGMVGNDLSYHIPLPFIPLPAGLFPGHAKKDRGKLTVEIFNDDPSLPTAVGHPPP